METPVLGARAPGEKSCRIDGLAFRFQERRSGRRGVGESDPRAGAARGARESTLLSFDVGVRIEDLGRFLRGLDRPAALPGAVPFGPLGGGSPTRNGRFHLFDVNGTSGVRQITYAFSFTAGDGKTYCLRGRKEVRDDPGA